MTRLHQPRIAASKLFCAASFVATALGSSIRADANTASTWSAVGGGDWSASANWINGSPDAFGGEADLVSNPGITSSSTITLDEITALGTLIFDNTVGGSSNSYTVSDGGSISAGLMFNNVSSQAVIDDEGGNQLISAAIYLQSPTTITVANAADTLTFSNSIYGNSSSGTVTIDGPGTVAFSQSMSNVQNTYTITVASGGNLACGASLPTTSDLVVSGNVNLSSTLPQLIGALNGSGTVNVKTNVSVQGGGSFAGTITGSGGLEVLGGTLVLSSANTYSGATLVEKGSLELTGAASLASSSMEVANKTTLIVDASLQNPSFSNVVVDGSATIKCSAATFSSLVVDVGGGVSLSSTALTLDGGGFTGPLTGNGSLTVAGSVVVDYSLAYSGPTTVSTGTLELDAANSLTGNVNVAAGATLFLYKYGTLSASTNLTNNGTVNVLGSSQFISTLNGNGAIYMDSGPIAITNGGTFSGSITGVSAMIVDGGTLNLSGSISAPSYTVETGATLNLGTSILNKPSLNSYGATVFGANAGTTGPLAITLGSVQVGSSGQITLDSAMLHSNREVLVVGSIAFANTPTALQGILNLKDNDMIVHNGSLSNLKEEIVAGDNGGLWNGQGITSSAAATTANTALGVELNSDGSSANGGLGNPLTTSFDGQTVTETDVLVKYTYLGDANLDGVVNGSDYILIDNGFNSQESTIPLSGWQNGDFNYDGAINGDDYTLIDNAFNSQRTVSYAGASAGPTEMIASATEQVAAVPEPTSAALVSIGAIAILRQRRRRS